MQLKGTIYRLNIIGIVCHRTHPQEFEVSAHHPSQIGNRIWHKLHIQTESYSVVTNDTYIIVLRKNKIEAPHAHDNPPNPAALEILCHRFFHYNWEE